MNDRWGWSKSREDMYPESGIPVTSVLASRRKLPPCEVKARPKLVRRNDIESVGRCCAEGPRTSLAEVLASGSQPE
jgi:hypothetical protein